MENENIISNSVDKTSSIISDIIPEMEIKIYPYEMPNASKSEEFVGDNTSSIVYITQDKLDVNDEFLLQDENGFKYFKIMAAITSEGKLDLSSSTSTLGVELKEEDSFNCLSNWYYESELDKVKIGNLRLLPAIFTIGKPFNEDEYKNDLQPVYLSTTMIEAKQGNSAQNVDINPEGLYEFSLGNVTTLESQFTNSKIYFTTTFDTQNDDILTFDKNQNGITLGFENHTLINYIKGKGKTNEFNLAGQLEGEEFGEIDFISNKPLAPFKMTPISTQDKVTMNADWFDYDVVMPFALIEKFKSNGKLSEVISVSEDLHLVEDMLAVSAGFANSWASAPLVTTAGDSGKIDPTFRIGYQGLKVSAIQGKDPIKVVDGLYETHIRNYPVFLTDPQRYQPVKEVLAALSRYLYTSYSIGKGQNSYNQVYLPWYLEPSKKIDFNSVTKITNPDKGKIDKVDTYILDDNITFNAKTNYFRKKHTDPIDLLPTNELILPPAVNLSNIKSMQADRKLTIPEVGYTISAINKLPLPGDIVTSSSDYLQYIWYLPIQATTNASGNQISAQQALEEFFLDELTTKSSVAKGTDIHLSPEQFVPGGSGVGIDGKIWVQADIDKLVQNIAAGNIKSQPVITQVAGPKRTLTAAELGYVSEQASSVNPGLISTDRIRRGIAIKYGYDDIASIQISSNTITEINGGTWNDGRDGGFNIRYSGNVVFTVTHSEFTEAVVTSNGSTQTIYSFEKRQTIFDKQQWKRFLTRFNFIPNSVINYELLEKDDFKITRLDEIIIGSIWGNYVELKINGSIIAKIELFNSTDETIVVQRIIFT